MKTKKLLYAAVGAPVVAAKNAQARVDEIRVKLGENAGSLTKDLESQLEQWAAEGEVLLGRIGDSKAVDELTERMDLDQVQEQVGKLREQLEDLLDTWRSNFRPGSERTEGSPVPQPRSAAVPAERTGDAPTATPEPPSGKAPAQKQGSQKSTAKKPTAKKPTSTKAGATKAAADETASEEPAGGSTPSAGASNPGTGRQGSKPKDASSS